MSKISEQRRQQILNAAYEAFCDKGVEAASMADIARRADIGKSTIYEYFPAKNELLVSTYVWLMNKMAEKIKEVFAQDIGFQEQLRCYMNTVIDGARGIRIAGNLLQLIDLYGTEALQHDCRDFQTMTIRAMAEGIRRANDRGELTVSMAPEKAAFLLWALLNPLLFTYTDTESLRTYMRSTGVEVHVEEAVNTVLYGICDRSCSAEAGKSV